MYVCMYVHAEDYYECAPKVTTWGFSVCVQNGTYACQLGEGDIEFSPRDKVLQLAEQHASRVTNGEIICREY